MRSSTRLRVWLQTLSPEQSGRRGPIWSGYRPNVWFGDIVQGQRAYYGVEVTLAAVDHLDPGQAGEATLQPLGPDYWPDVQENITLELYEGARLVATARLLAIVVEEV